MPDPNAVEKMLGQDTAYAELTGSASIRQSCIVASVGQGKHYLIEKLSQYFFKKDGLCVLRMSANVSPSGQKQDFAPFLAMLTAEEKLTAVNMANWGKSFAELLPYIGKSVSKIVDRKKVYPAIYSNTEIELLMRLERMIAHRPVLLICEEIDRFDQPSAQFLRKLLSCSGDVLGKNVRFICTSCSEGALFPADIFDRCFHLCCVQMDQMNTLWEILVPRQPVEEELLRKIHLLSGGNIGIMLQLIHLVTGNDADSIYGSCAYRDIMLQRLQILLDEFRYDCAVCLLDRASLIGERSYKELLRLFTKYEPVAFSESIRASVNGGVLQEEPSMVSFTDHATWQAFHAFNQKNQQFHYELAHCIKKLTPSNFSYIGDELLLADQEQEAASCYVLAALNYYHFYRIQPELPDSQMNLINKFSLRDAYRELLALFHDYFAGHFSKVISTPFHFKDTLLQFEAEYVKALAYINGYLSLSAYKQALTLLESWLEDQQFYMENPYQWMRGALLALGAKYELHDKSMPDLIKWIEKTRRQYPNDPGMEWLELDFLSKCNYCYSIDTAYHYVKSAVETLKRYYARLPSGYPYYRALVNAAANSLVLGKYEETLQYSKEALLLEEQNGSLYGAVDALTNNVMIASLLYDPSGWEKHSELCIRELKRLEELAEEDVITSILLRNNIAVMLCYCGKFESAINELSSLRHELLCLNDVDDYYLYVIGSNECILNTLLGRREFDWQDFDTLCQLRPLDLDHAYFAARNQYIKENIAHVVLSRPWRNDFDTQKVGPAWSFWGKWLIFSDIQIWSD